VEQSNRHGAGMPRANNAMSATTRAAKVREARTSSEGDIFGHLAGGEPPEGVEAPQAFQILAARAGGWQGTPTGFSSGNRCLARQSRTRLAVAAMRIAISNRGGHCPPALAQLLLNATIGKAAIMY
jgi:hypothetical protein